MVNANPAAISAKVAAAGGRAAAGAGGRAAVNASQPPQAAAAAKLKKPAVPKAEKSLPENPQVHRTISCRYNLLCLIPPFADEAPSTATERDVRSAGV